MLAKEKVDALQAVQAALAQKRRQTHKERREILGLLDSYEARLRVVEKFLKYDVMVDKGTIETLIPKAREGLDAHRAHLNAIIAQSAMEHTDQSRLSGHLRKMMRMSQHGVDMLLAMMGQDDFEMTFFERRRAVHLSGGLVLEVEDNFRTIEEHQRRFDLAKRSATANLKNAELEFVKLGDKIGIEADPQPDS